MGAGRTEVIEGIFGIQPIDAGEIYVRGQEHFYLEGQISEARLTEDGGIHVISSSQHPTELQKLVAEVISIPFHLVVAEVRLMGGGFGGCTLNLVEKDASTAFLSKMKEAYFNAFGIELPHYFVEPSDGATLLS